MFRNYISTKKQWKMETKKDGTERKNEYNHEQKWIISIPLFITNIFNII